MTPSYGSCPTSPAKGKVGSTVSTASDTLSSSLLLAPPTGGLTTTGKGGTQLSPSNFTTTFTTFAKARSATSSSAISSTVSSLCQPQTLLHSLLTSVCYIVTAWKECTPGLRKTQSSTESSVSPIVRPDTIFSLHRCISWVKRVQQPASENAASGPNPPSTPRSTNNNNILPLK